MDNTSVRLSLSSISVALSTRSGFDSITSDFVTSSTTYFGGRASHLSRLLHLRSALELNSTHLTRRVPATGRPSARFEFINTFGNYFTSRGFTIPRSS